MASKRSRFSIPSLPSYIKRKGSHEKEPVPENTIIGKNLDTVENCIVRNAQNTENKMRNNKSVSETVISGIYKKVSAFTPERKSKDNGLVNVKVGSPVITPYGGGILIDIRPITQLYIVKLNWNNAIGYLNSNGILKQVKAFVGDRVRTDYGLGNVEDYLIEEDLYEIALDWRWDDNHIWRLKATAEKIEKVSNKKSLYKRTTGYFSGFKSTTSSNFSTMKTTTTGGLLNKKSLTTGGLYSVKAKLSEITNSTRSKTLVEQRETLSTVLTPFGQGFLQEIKESTNIHIINLPGYGQAFVQASYCVDVQNPLLKESIISIGSSIKTPYGIGKVIEYRRGDDIYEIYLDWNASLFISSLSLGNYCFQGDGKGRFSSFVNLTTSALKSTSNTVTGSYANMKARFSSITSNTSKKPLSSINKIGDRLVTPFGSGFLMNERSDHVLVIRLRRAKALAYMQPQKTIPFPYELVVQEDKKMPKQTLFSRVLKDNRTINIKN